MRRLIAMSAGLALLSGCREAVPPQPGAEVQFLLDKDRMDNAATRLTALERRVSALEAALKETP